MFNFNIFSNKRYVTTDSVMVDQNGKTFVQSDDDWISQDGDYIQKTENGFMSLRSGARSEFSDPFGDDDDN